jgi:hypothetical protein
MIRWLGKEMDNAVEYPWYGKLPPGFARMKQNACFSNAQELVLRREGLRYVEGEAWKDGMLFPCHHAWVINEDDQVIDVTWTRREQSPRVYRGAVVADRDELKEHLIMKGAEYYYPFMCCLSDLCWCINLLDLEET